MSLNKGHRPPGSQFWLCCFSSRRQPKPNPYRRCHASRSCAPPRAPVSLSTPYWTSFVISVGLRLPRSFSNVGKWVSGSAGERIRHRGRGRSLQRRRRKEPRRRPEVQEPASTRMAHQEPEKVTRPQVHAHAVGLQRFGRALPVHCHHARHDAARP